MPETLDWSQVAEFPKAKLRVSHVTEHGKSRLKIKEGDIIENDPNALKNVFLNYIQVRPQLISLKQITKEHAEELLRLEHFDPEEPITDDDILHYQQMLTSKNVDTNSNFPELTIHEFRKLLEWNYNVYWWKNSELCELIDITITPNPTPPTQE
jgi:hypothetical protein